VDFERDDIPLDSLPDWFLAVTDGEPDDGSPEHAGKRNYLAARENSTPWDAEEWIYCFDPDLRSWSWWDLTEDGDGGLTLWVSTRRARRTSPARNSGGRCMRQALTPWSP
jgi:hypothetical protein